VPTAQVPPGCVVLSARADDFEQLWGQKLSIGPIKELRTSEHGPRGVFHSFDSLLDVLVLLLGHHDQRVVPVLRASVVLLVAVVGAKAVGLEPTLIPFGMGPRSFAAVCSEEVLDLAVAHLGHFGGSLPLELRQVPVSDVLNLNDFSVLAKVQVDVESVESVPVPRVGFGGYHVIRFAVAYSHFRDRLADPGASEIN
jgi:hypothetical protein